MNIPVPNITVIYKLGAPEIFSQIEKNDFFQMLVNQNKVKNPSITKLNGCRALCICFENDKMVSIGAIKPKTASDFEKPKADLPSLSNSFNWELGYCYTHPSFERKGYSSQIVKLLVTSICTENLLASTELRVDNSMVHILERNGFKQTGKIWKSGIHEGILGLFLRIVK